MQNLVVGAALFHPFNKPVVVDPQKSHAQLIEPFAQVRLIIVMQLFAGVSANFVQHAAEIDQPADAGSRAANS